MRLRLVYIVNLSGIKPQCTSYILNRATLNIENMILEVVLFSFCVLLFRIYYKHVYRDYYKLIENFDNMGPALPIVGHVYMFLGIPASDKVWKMCDLASKCQNSSKGWCFSKLVIFLNTPQDIQTVLNSTHCLEKGTPYKAMGSCNSIITSHPTIWKVHRRMLNACFNLRTSLKLVPQVNTVARELVNDLEPYSGQGEISLLEIIGIRIMEINLYSLLNYSFDKESLIKVYHLMDQVMEILGNRVVKFYYNIIYAYIEKILKIVPKEVKLCHKVGAILDKAFVAGKQKYMPDIEEDAKKISSEEELRNTPDEFLKRIYRMAYHNLLNINELEETIATVIFAGSDTTARTIANVILCLAMNPEIQEKLYDELKEALGDDEEIDFYKILQIDYLNRVIKESIRYINPVPIIVRRANKNVQLEHGVIPAGTDIFIPIQNIHKSERIWGPNVSKFDPDHFLPENYEKRHPCSFMGFSYGPRNCIGHRYARINLKVVTANLVRKYRFDTHLKPEDLSFGFGLTAKLLTDYNISLTKRV